MISRRTFVGVAGSIALAGRATAQPPPSPNGVTKLVFVHGRDQQGKDPVALKASWVETLERGLRKARRSLPAGTDIAFPYYADVLDEFTRQSELPLTEDVRTRGAPVDDGFLTFQAEMAEAMRQGAGVSDADVNAEYGANPKPRGPLNWEWVQAIVRAIDRRTPGFTENTLEEFMRDVYLYISRVSVRETIDNIVKETITADRTVVVGHSLGSVVAYSVLTYDERPLQVPLYLSVGSPLGLRPIRKAFVPLKYPPPVRSWYNAFDGRDVVALYPLDGDNFAVDPAIKNNGGVQNSTDNRHGIVGYLDDENVARQIADALGAP